MQGVEVTYLGDGGLYFAPPGDFSKVDFSVCQQQQPSWGECHPFVTDERDGVCLQFVGPRGSGDGYWLARIVRAGVEESGYSNDPDTALEMMGLGRLKMSSYGPVNQWPIEAIAPPAAQKQERAKPALPSLMTEAGEKYRGLGFCSEGLDE